MAHGSRPGEGGSGTSSQGRQRVPEAAVDLVVASVSLADVVRARGIELKRRGKEQVGLCPFHDDHNASLGVRDDRGFFKCHSCGAKGDAIAFVQQFDGVDFRTALADLAQMAGVDVPELHGGQAKPMSDEQRAALERRRAEAAAKRDEQRKIEEAERSEAESVARTVFEDAHADAGDGLAAGYLQGRGIDTAAAWPAGFCADLRSAAGTTDFVAVDGAGEDDDGRRSWKRTTGTMMVGLLRNARGQGVGVQRIYVEEVDGRVRKRSGDRPAKMTLGTAGGACVRLSERDPRDMDSPRLILAEGIETAAAVMAARYGEPTWAALSTSGLETFELPDELRGTLHAVVIAADLDKSGAGERAARICAARIYEQSPGVTVRIALPRPEQALGLFDAQGEPRAKSVDWLDVYREAGAGVVAEAMDEAGVVAKPNDSEIRNGSGNGADGGGGGYATPDDDDDPHVFAGTNHVAFAKRVLEDLYAPPQDERAGSRWLLAYYDGAWYRRLPGEARWRKDNPDRVQAQVLLQLDRYRVMKRGKPKSLEPTAQTARGVMEAMAAECGVYAEQLPAWAPATFDDVGTPLWSKAAHVYDAIAGAIDPRSAVATRSGILDADAWAEGQLRVEPLSPLWFSSGELPHELPLEAMRKAIDPSAVEDGLEGAELFGSLCPTWLDFLRDITEPYAGGDNDLTDADRWIMGLQEWFGYLLTYDTRFETIGLMTGPTRSGKGTVQTAMRSILNASQVASSTFQELAERWKPMDLVDKPVCIMSDASIGRYTDSIACAERLKNIRGGDPLSIEKHGKGFVGAVVVPTRVMIFVNELPKLPDSAGALAGSMVNWPTAKSFAGQEDRTLKARIAAEGAGIMVWALFGLRRLRQRGEFTRCMAGEAVLDELKAMGSPVYSFVAEECLVGQGQEVVTKVLHDLYTDWAKREGVGELSNARFGAQLKAAFPGVERQRRTDARGRREWVYTGVRPTMHEDDLKPRTIWTADDIAPPPVDGWAADSPYPSPER